MLADRIRANKSFRLIDSVTDNEYSYHELEKITWPVSDRSLVFCYLSNSFKSVSFFVKALESNHVLVVLSSALQNNQKTNLENTYQPTIIFDEVRLEIDCYDSREKFLFKRKNSVEHILHKDVRILLSTSGTTGSPKFVKLSERNLLSNAESISAYLPILETDMVPLNLPIHYSYGLSILTSNALIGASLITGVEDLMSKSFWDSFVKYRFSTIAGVPYVYEILDRLGFTQMSLPSLRYFTQAGGKLREDLIRKYAEFARDSDKLFYVMYGQTEATARMSFIKPCELLNHIGSIGKPIPGGRFEVNQETSELLYEGPNIYGGYAECIQDLATFSSPSILRTGDLAKVDQQGFYFITGRIKRIVKIFGNRINLDELESALSKRFGSFYACVGWHDKFICVFTSNQNENPKQIIRWLNLEYRVHPSTFKVKAINAIPLNGNGKPDYSLLMRDYEDR